MGETYIQVKDEGFYLYRAVEKFAQAIDSMLSKKCDEVAAGAFLSTR